jgi:hypothetical protein
VQHHKQRVPGSLRGMDKMMEKVHTLQRTAFWKGKSVRWFVRWRLNFFEFILWIRWSTHIIKSQLLTPVWNSDCKLHLVSVNHKTTVPVHQFTWAGQKYGTSAHSYLPRKRSLSGPSPAEL